MPKNYTHNAAIHQRIGVAVCCGVWQCVAACCSVLQCIAMYCSGLQRVAVCCSVLQRVAAFNSVLRWQIQLCIYIHTHTQTHTHTHTRVCLCVCVYIWIYIYTHILYTCMHQVHTLSLRIFETTRERSKMNEATYCDTTTAYAAPANPCFFFLVFSCVCVHQQQRNHVV